MRKSLLLTVLILAALCVCCAALADDYPVNPYQEEVWEFDRMANMVGKTRGGYYYDGKITITELQTPAIGQAGRWQVNVRDGLTVTERSISIQSMDPAGYYSTEYRIKNPTDTIESCEFVAPGVYQVCALYDFSDGTGSAAEYEVVIEEDGVHPTVAQKVNEILGECRVAGDDWQTALNLHDWLTHHAYYDYSYSFYGAEDVLMRGYGVCDSYSKAYAYLLNAAGITQERARSKGHAWNVITLGSREYHVDATWDDGGDDEVPVSGNESHEYFCLNDELIYGFMDQNESHKKDATVTGRCSSLAESYPMHTGEWRNYGRYYDSSYTLRNYQDLIREGAAGTENPFTIQANGRFPAEQAGYSYAASASPAVYDRYFLAYGLTNEGLEMTDGTLLDVEVTYDTDDLFFTVKVLGVKEAGYSWDTANARWTLSETEVLPGEAFRVSVTYNGHALDEITLAISQGRRTASYTGTGSSISGTFSADNSSQVYITCYGKYNDGSQHTVMEEYDGPLTVKPGKEAPIPSISIVGERASDTNGTITFRMYAEEPDRNADYSDVSYEIAVAGEGSGAVTAIGDYPADGSEQTITMDQIRGTGFYVAENVQLRLQARAYGPGYESQTTMSRKLYVTGTRDESFSISVSSMLGNDTARLVKNAANTVRVNAPDGVNTIEICKGDNNWIACTPDDQDEISFFGYEDETRDAPLVARYTDVTGARRYSNVIFADYVSKLATPTAALTESTEAGRPIDITLSSVEGADEYSVRIFNAVSGWSVDTKYFNRSGTVALAETGLDGGEYLVRVSARSWRGLLNSDEAEYPLTVTGTRPAAPTVTMPTLPETVKEGETYWITLEAEGMEAAAQEYHSTLYSAQNGKAMVPVTIQYYAQDIYFRGLTGGRWSERTPAIEIPAETETDQPEIQGPTVTYTPAQPKRGQDLRLNVSPVEGGEVYTVSLALSGEETILYDMPFDIAEGGVTIQGCNLMRAGDYDITVSVYRGNYMSTLCETDLEITVADNTELPDAPTATLLTETNLLYGETRFRVVTGGGADKVYTYVHKQDEYGTDENPLETVINPTATECVISWENRNCGTFEAYFSVSRDGAWSETYGPVVFNVPYAEDWDAEPLISVHPEEPEAGQAFTISWTDTEEADRCEISVYKQNEEVSIEETTGAGISSFTAGANTIQHSGEMRIYLRAYRSGYYAAYSETLLVTVLDPALKLNATLLSADAAAGTVTLQLSNVAANRIRVRIDGKDAGLYGLGNEHGSTMLLTVPVSSMSSRIQVANYDTDDTKWGTWSDAVTGQDAVAYQWDCMLPAGLKEIGPEAFTQTRVNCVRIPDGCERIKARAFAEIQELTMIYIPDSVEEIGEGAIPEGIIIVTPAGSYAETWAGNRYTIRRP